MIRKAVLCSALFGVSLAAFAASEIIPDAARTSPASHGVQASSAKPSAVIFSKKSSSLTVKKAYNLQKAFVRNSVAKGVDIVGFKGGLTTPEAARAMGLESPISGVLLQAPLHGPNAELSLEGTRNLMLELEVAYRMAKPVNEKVTVAELPQYIEAVAPAIEIPEMNFASNDFNGLDVIANNAMAHKLVIGEWQPAVGLATLDAMPVSLACNGKVLAEGKGSNTMGGQGAALAWLVNHILDQGYKIQKGQVLITGTLIKIVPASPCGYRASFGRLGNLGLAVKP